jgi:ADP-heptose:LPS heptosyltransferase
MQDEAVAGCPPYPAGSFSGQGIVIPASGPQYFTCAWVSVNVLRQVIGCTLPIEVWYCGPGDMSPQMIDLLASLDVACVDALGDCEPPPARFPNGWELKVYALLHSRFKDMIYLDADNVMAIDPSSLLCSEEYVRTGTLFWPGGFGLAPDNAIWRICGVPYHDEMAVQGGQMVIDKERCWRALQLALYFNEHSELYYGYTVTDEPILQLAWKILGQPYATVPDPHVVTAMRVSYQRDPQGRVVFQHRMGPKWSAWGENPRVPGFAHEAECLDFLRQLREQWDGKVVTLAPVVKPGRSPEEEIIRTRRFVYRLVGAGERILELLPGYRIGRGRGRLEYGWYLLQGGAQPTLVIEGLRERGRVGPTCTLTRGDVDGIWRGRWLEYEKLAVELVPCADDGDMPEDTRAYIAWVEERSIAHDRSRMGLMAGQRGPTGKHLEPDRSMLIYDRLWEGLRRARRAGDVRGQSVAARRLTLAYGGDGEAVRARLQAEFGGDRLIMASVEHAPARWDRIVNRRSRMSKTGNGGGGSGPPRALQGRAPGALRVEELPVIALERPQDIRMTDVGRCEETLQRPGLRPQLYEAAIAGLSAVLYSRPELIQDPTVEALGSVLTYPGLPDRIYESAGAVLAFCASTREAPDVARSFAALLMRPDLEAKAYDALCTGLEHAISWLPDAIDLDTAVTLAEQGHLSDRRELLQERVIEPCILGDPAGVTVPLLERLLALFGRAPEFRFPLYYVSQAAATPELARSAATGGAAGRFPLHDVVAQNLATGPRRVLMVQNIADAQGDEIIRTVPLLQALLDFNHELEVELVTNRAYLYAHPRVTVVPFPDRARILHLLTEPWDVVIDCFEAQIQEVNHDPVVGSALRQRVRPLQGSDAWADRGWPSFLYLSIGKGHNLFVFERLAVASQGYASRLGLRKQRVPNIYETTFRLIAELGLPLRLGEDRPRSESVLAGLPCPEAEAGWAELTRGNAEGRPVALLNPFGGGEELKGFVKRQFDELADQIRGLIAEGFYVILLPSGQPWGSECAAAEVAGRLAPTERACVAIAPDPGGSPDEAVELSVLRGVEMSYASYRMHLTMYFVRFAELIVAVEGWMVHAAYCLGKSYRVAMLPYSHPFEWHPYGRTRRQRAVARISDAAPRRPAVSALRAGAETPPLEAKPRKNLFLFVLQVLGKGRDPSAIDPLLRALPSEDRTVRRTALEALGWHARDDRAHAALLEGLRDGHYTVRARAARALLRAEEDARQNTELQAHALIGAESRDWNAVIALGPAVRPILERIVAADGEDPVIRREAGWALVLLRRSEASRRAEKAVTESATRTRIGRPRLLATPGLLARRLTAPKGKAPHSGAPQQTSTILILTPVKDAGRYLPRYRELLNRLTYPHRLISIGFLESDSFDGTYEAVKEMLPGLQREFRRAGARKRDFGYMLPRGIHRGAESIQIERRVTLARSRNHLLFYALDDEDWVLWLDVDVIEYPPDIIEQLLATGKDIVQPHCVLRYGGPTFDENAWRDAGKLHLDDLRGEGDLVRLDTVGGTMLLVRADVHRDGLVFPAFLYGKESGSVREGRGELETEGLGIMAADMGYECWGMPHLEILHVNE